VESDAAALGEKHAANANSMAGERSEKAVIPRGTVESSETQGKIRKPQPKNRGVPTEKGGSEGERGLKSATKTVFAPVTFENRPGKTTQKEIRRGAPWSQLGERETKAKTLGGGSRP